MTSVAHTLYRRTLGAVADLELVHKEYAAEYGLMEGGEHVTHLLRSALTEAHFAAQEMKRYLERHGVLVD